MTNYDIRIKGDRAIREMEMERMRPGYVLTIRTQNPFIPYSDTGIADSLAYEVIAPLPQSSDCVLVQPDPNAHLGGVESE